jgi:hypothetical protein
MSLLYKDSKDVTIAVSLALIEGKIVLDFSSDCGKFGTDEMLDGYTLTPERLLEILQEREDITDEENDS